LFSLPLRVAVRWPRCVAGAPVCARSASAFLRPAWVGLSRAQTFWVGAECPVLGGGLGLSSFWFPRLRTTSAARPSG